MATSRNIIFVILLVCALFGNAFAQTYPWNNIQTHPNNINVEIDSTTIYQDLIKQESARANYNANKVGIVIGGAVICLGGFVLFLAENQSNQPTDKSKSQIDQIGEGLGNAINTFILGILGVMITGGGGAILAVNIVKYKRHKRHAEKRDEYQEALNRYMEQKHSMRFVVTPAVNLLSGGGGLNAILQF